MEMHTPLEVQEGQDTITHFSHPGHELVKRHHMGRFLCDMCWEALSGSAYSCLAGCNFDIHESCAGHPQTLSSPAHHEHPLVLVPTGRDVIRMCDVCFANSAPGSFLYRCPPCGFDMHPRCARLPQVVRVSRHPAHDLTLVVADGSCAACARGAGRASYYRCTTCNVDFHVSCAATADDNNNAQACHEGNSHVQAPVSVAAELIGARIRAQGIQAALDLLDPPNVRRVYYY